MKKYYNKALIFEWFNSVKAIIILGMIVWGFEAVSILNNGINNVKNGIAYSFNNNFSNSFLMQYTVLAFIFIAIFYGSIGISRKNKLVFLGSGPYTKKQIKFNELLCMTITLIIFVIEYIYLIIMNFIKYRELMTIVNGYWSIMGIEVLKVFVLGFGGVLTMMVLDMLFTNTIAAMVSMVSILPASVLAIFSEIIRIICYVPKNIVNDVTKYDYNNIWISKHPLFESISINNLDLRYILSDMFITLICIGVIFLIFIVMEKKNKMEVSVKIFASRKSENIVLGLSSALIGIALNIFLMDNFIIDKIAPKGDGGFYYGSELAAVIGTELFFVIVISVISFIILKRIVKKFAY